MNKLFVAVIAFCARLTVGVSLQALMEAESMVLDIWLKPVLAFRCAILNILVEDCEEYFKGIDERCYDENIFSEANCNFYLRFIASPPSWVTIYFASRVACARVATLQMWPAEC